ncbi:MAG: hypothetical protein WAK48_21705 [Candidatus Acidiferrum sp.]|jgi:hypothetical protein
MKQCGPVLTLILLAPVIAEILLGSTRLSILFILIPQILLWGLGALMIREAVRRARLDTRSLLLMGAALGLSEEFIIQQTSLAPLPWLGPGHDYGRAFGVNWVWLLAMLGWEAVWVTVVPIHLTEIIWRDRRRQPWLRTRGWMISIALFLTGSMIAWYGWTYRARPMVFHAPIYSPPFAPMLIAAVVIVALIAIALYLPARLRRPRGQAPGPWLAGIASFVFAEGWVGLIQIAGGSDPNFQVTAALLAGIAWAAAAYALMERWSGGSGWTDAHRMAAIIGANVALMTNGWQGVWRLSDIIFRVAVGGGIVLLTIVQLGRLPIAEAEQP